MGLDELDVEFLLNVMCGVCVRLELVDGWDIVVEADEGFLVWMDEWVTSRIRILRYHVPTCHLLTTEWSQTFSNSKAFSRPRIFFVGE